MDAAISRKDLLTCIIVFLSAGHSGNEEEKVNLGVIWTTSVWQNSLFFSEASIALNNGVFPLMPYIRLFHLSLSVQPVSACMTNDDKMNAIKNCTETQKGIDLIIAHGNATQTNISPLYFVPAIEIDNVSLDIKSIMLPSLTLYPLQEFNQDDQDDLLYHFSRDFCKRYRAKYHKKLSNC